MIDFKVYQKEEVLQPSGNEKVYVPDIIDIIPTTIEVPSTSDIRHNVWSLDKLKRVADVRVEDGKLIINSDKVRYENGNLYVTINDTHIISCETVKDKELSEQRCALATIFQRGQDPLDLNDGVRWSEAMLGEISAVQLMDDISNAVEKASDIATVVFDTVTDSQGRSYLSYKISEVE